MLSETIQQAQNAIKNYLAEAKGPVKAGSMLDNIKKDKGLKDNDLGAAVWLLIGTSEIYLTWDRKLVSQEYAHLQPVRGKSYASQSS